MKELFGDDTVKEQTMIDDDSSKMDEVITDKLSEEQNHSVKKRTWLKQKKGQKKSHKKGTSKKPASVKNAQQINTPNARKKEDKVEKESSKDKLSDDSDSDADSDRSDDEDSHDKKDVSIDDDDTDWER